MEQELFFPKAEIDPGLIKLQVIAKEFIIWVILKHEKILYNLISKMSNKNHKIIMTTNKTIIDLIIECTNTFFNKCYLDVQNQNMTLESETITEMSYYAKYSPHILLNKLIHVTLDIHIDIVRENLCIDNIDEYNNTLQEEINRIFLSTVNLAHVLSKGPNDDEKFIKVAGDENPFKVIIDKHIGLQ